MSIILYLQPGTIAGDRIRFQLSGSDMSPKQAVQSMVRDGGAWFEDVFIPWHRVVRIEVEVADEPR